MASVVGNFLRKSANRIFTAVPAVLIFSVLGVFWSCGGGGSGGGNSAPDEQEDPIILAELNVQYGFAEGEALQLDVYRAKEGEEKRPGVLLLHGGGWIAGDKSENADLGEGLAKLGYVAFAINYRLTTEQKNKFPAPIDDAQLAARWVRSVAEQYGVDSERLGVIGGSAGGHLANILGTQDTRAGASGLDGFSSRVGCVVSIAGPSDLTAKFPSAPADIQGLLAFVLGSYSAQAASPIFSIDGRSARFLHLHGVLDDVVPFSQASSFHAALLAAGRDSKLVPLPQSGHAIIDPVDAATVANETIGFLKDCLGE